MLLEEFLDQRRAGPLMRDTFGTIEPAGNLEGRTALKFSPLTDILPEHSDGNTRGTNADPATKVAIVGAGRGGTALLELLHQIPSIDIVGIAGIAHDINNALQQILGLAEILVDEQAPAVVREHSKEIIEAVKRTSAICCDLTKYARRSSVRGDTLVCLNGQLDEALKIARHAASFHDNAVIRQYTPGAAVRGNPDELLHVFVNLIMNAIHSMDHSGGTLTLATSMSGNGAGVRITDTGCGIDPDTSDQIFEPFFTTKEPGKGTGLGLYNVKTIVGKMHGTITVESEVDRGTTFTLTFPASDPWGGNGAS